MGDLFSGEEKELKIVQVENGYIVKVECTGQSAYCEPYKKAMYIFESKKELTYWMNDFFEPTEQSEGE